MKQLKPYEGIIEIIKIENTGDNADQIGTLTAWALKYQRQVNGKPRQRPPSVGGKILLNF